MSVFSFRTGLLSPKFEAKLFAVIFTLLWFIVPISGVTGPAYAQERSIADHVREVGIPFSELSDLDRLIDRAGDHRLVLLGEASHGTSEYYSWRAGISKRLMEEKGFDFVIVEGDWPLAFRVNLHVKHLEQDPKDSREALSSFTRWPEWMWRNEEILELISWMHHYNEDRPEWQRAGFYGLDVYAYEQGIRDVLDFLREADGAAADRAERLYGCFSRHPDMNSYLQSVHSSRQHCGDELEEVHGLLEENKEQYMASDSTGFVNVLQSSRMIVFAERHIRGNLEQGPQSWNHRADHFYDAAARLLEQYGENARGIVWAHNTHIGDARATDMRNAGMKNIGQIAREEMGEDHVYAIGFGTYRGEVFAGRQWQGSRELMTVPEAIPGSYEEQIQQAGIPKVLLMFDNPDDHEPLLEPRGNRAIGVVYQPEQDAQQNYVETVMPVRYDAFMFFEETGALDPLD